MYESSGTERGDWMTQQIDRVREQVEKFVRCMRSRGDCNVIGYFSNYLLKVVFSLRNFSRWIFFGIEIEGKKAKEEIRVENYDL